MKLSLHDPRGVAEEDDARMTGLCLDGSHDLGEGRKDKDTKDMQNAPETVSFVALN
jgi:hypothetical protein